MQALATRCPDCGTSFRVQVSQLSASQGFVRCGRCDGVFDARQSLFDLSDGQPVTLASDDTPAPAPPEGPPAGSEPEALPAQSETHATEPRPVESREPTWGDSAQNAAALDGHAPADTPSGRPEPGWHEPTWAEDETQAQAEALPPAEVNERLRALLGAKEPSLADTPAVASAWSSLAPVPAAKAPQRLTTALAWLVAAVLALALPLQWAWVERAALRARSPGLDHLWRQVCAACEAPAWAQIDGLRVGASSLQPTPQGQAYQLQLTLHNGTPHPLALPWLDLRLQDAQGRVVVRRAISPQELGARGDRLAAGGQLGLQGTFRLQADHKAPAGISGYEIGLFHP